jgi:hypothetical protein
MVRWRAAIAVQRKSGTSTGKRSGPAKVTNKATKTVLFAASALALVFALPALGQQGPESLLPEGFGDPTPPPPTNRPTPNPAGQATPSPSARPTTPSDPLATADTDNPDDAKEEDEEEDEEEEELVIRYDVPPAARRSLSAVGIISSASGGFPAESFGALDGNFLKQIVNRTTGPIASRWGTILGRRLLVSRTNTPKNINGADWTAERAWLLLRMGDSVSARHLVQEVDAGK